MPLWLPAAEVDADGMRDPDTRALLAKVSEVFHLWAHVHNGMARDDKRAWDKQGAATDLGNALRNLSPVEETNQVRAKIDAYLLLLRGDDEDSE